MKKILLGCIVTLGLASCSNDNVVMEQNDANKINFSVTTQGNSRATDIYCPNNMFDSFTVCATDGTNTFFEGDVATVVDGKWQTSITRYWPNSGTLSFYAHVNGDDSFVWNSAAAPTFANFAPATDVASQLDLLYAVAAGKSKPAEGTADVPLNFRHALSQIVFKAKNTNPNLYIEISGVSVCQVDGNGTFTFPTASTEGNLPHTNPAGNPVQGTWATNNVSSYSVNFDATPVICVKGEEGNTSDVVNLTDNTGNADHQTDNAFGPAMLLLPQTTAACAITETSRPATGVYFAVKCKIWNVATPNADGIAADNDVVLYPSASDEPQDVLIPVSIVWEQGKKYIYTFVFGNGNGGWTPDPEDPDPVLVPITFDVTVDEFLPVENQDIEMSTVANN